MMRGTNRSPEDTLEDLTFMDENGVGAADAAARSGFPSAEAMEKWLHRHDAYPLWLRMKARDPEGMHDKKARRLHMTETPNDTIATLISKAQKSTRKRTQNKADRISDLVADLRRTLDLEEHEDRAKEVARKDVERLERELREAKARLKGGPVATDHDAPKPADIREWAKGAGVPCPDRGVIPTSVREAFEAAS